MPKQDQILRNRQWLADKANEPGVDLIDKTFIAKCFTAGTLPHRHPTAIA